MAVVIRSVGVGIPKNRISNEELTKRVETTDEWIRSHTGIGARHIAEDGEMVSDLAAQASRDALAQAGVAATDVGLIILASVTPDYFGFPASACIVQDKIGAPQAAAFDINAACTGFVYACDIASSMMTLRGYKYALVIGAEILSRVVDWTDRSSCVLFGDGAGAALLELNDEKNTGILASFLGADGKGACELRLDQTMRTAAFTRETPITPTLFMNGKAVYNFAVSTITRMIPEFLAKHNFKVEDVAYFVPHQANERIIEAAAKRLGIPVAKFYMNLVEYANTSSATVPIALNEMLAKKLIKKGDLVITLAFGGGLTYGIQAIRF